MVMQAEVETNVPICRTQICKRPLTYLEKQGCWRCLVCNPIPKDVPIPKQEKKFLDVAMTEKRVKEILAEQVVTSEGRIREIVQDELMNWHISKPPTTRDEIDALTEHIVQHNEKGEVSSSIVTATSLGWRQQAKELSIPLMKEPKGTGARKKEDVLAEIAEKTGV